MTIKVFIVKGRLESLGDTYTWSWLHLTSYFITYGYMQFVTNSGEEILAKNVLVPDELTAFLQVGAEGTFIFTKSKAVHHGSGAWLTHLHALRVQGNEAIAAWLLDDAEMEKLYPRDEFWLGCVTVGIGFIVYFLEKSHLEMLRRVALESARQEGFRLQTPRVI